MLYNNYKKVYFFRKFCLFIRESIRNFFLLHLCLKSSLSTNKKYEKKYKKPFFLDFASFLSLGLESSIS